MISIYYKNINDILIKIGTSKLPQDLVNNQSYKKLISNYSKIEIPEV